MEALQAVNSRMRTVTIKIEMEQRKILGIIACDNLQFQINTKYQKLKCYTSLLFEFEGQKILKKWDFRPHNLL